MPQRYLIRFIGWRMKAPAAGAPTGRMAPSARRPRPAPRSPAARTPAPPRRVPVTAPRVPPAARRSRASHTPTTTHALATPIFRRFWPRPAILRHDPSLAASPPPRYTLKRERSGLLSLYRNNECNVTGVVGARMEDFASGTIYWSAVTSAHEVHGAILAKFRAARYAAYYGLPITDESKTPGGIGRYNHISLTIGDGKPVPRTTEPRRQPSPPRWRAYGK